MLGHRLWAAGTIVHLRDRGSITVLALFFQWCRIFRKRHESVVMVQMFGHDVQRKLNLKRTLKSPEALS